MIPQRMVDRWYPVHTYDYTAQFFDWVRESASPGSVVLDLGAGAGDGEARCTLKGEVAEVIGVDIDPAVVDNRRVDRGVVTDGVTLPFADATFDLVYSDYVLEHVERPVPLLAEVRRVLKPDAKYFFRTPNLYHYVTLASRFSPHRVHATVANRARALPAGTHAPWPAYYRMNTRRAITAAARRVGFSSVELRMVEGEPAYLQFHIAAFLAGLAYERLVSRTEILADLRGNIFGCLTR